MNRTKIKNYAPQARRDFLQAVKNRAAFYGLTETRIEPVTVQGDVAIIGGRAFPREVGAKRRALQERVERDGYGPTMEALAYTWFNRLVAIRYMELHGYLEHGYRVLSNPNPARGTPEILDQAEHVDLPDLNLDRVIELKLDGSKEAELYRMLLVAQCNALHSAMPFLFERIGDETELVLPESLLHSDSIVRKLVSGIDEADWQEVEVIGWLYQFYVENEKKRVDEYSKKRPVESKDIPAKTQLFTPKWIVKYLLQNTLGRQWLATYPQSTLHKQMEFYIEPTEQSVEVQEQLKAITPTTLNPEEITLLDPACGSGHILVEAYDLFKAVYLERGYRAKDIPRLVLDMYLFGLEIDNRAAQLASFALMMKARADDRQIFVRGTQPNIVAIQASKELNTTDVVASLGGLDSNKKYSRQDVDQLIKLFEQGKTFGSLIEVPEPLLEKLPKIIDHIVDLSTNLRLFDKKPALAFLSLCQQALVLGKRYDAVVANPPYMSSLCKQLKHLAITRYSLLRPDLFAMFMGRGFKFTKQHGCMAMVTMHSWMFLKSFSRLRQEILNEWTINSMVHLGPQAFPAISGEIVQTTAFSLLHSHIPQTRPTFFRLLEGDSELKRNNLLARNYRNAHLIASDFFKVPLHPIAFWLSDSAVNVFKQASLLGDVAEPRKGMVTSDNPRFIRTWWEVSLNKIGFSVDNREESKRSGRKWFPYQKGGEFRLWYGNLDYVVNWENDGYELLHLQEEGHKVGSTNHNLAFIFKPALVWTKITATPNFRLSYKGFLFDDASGLCPVKNPQLVMAILGLLNSPITPYYLKAFNPTLNLNPGNLVNVPLLPHLESVTQLVEALVNLAKDDWNHRETSSDFISLPMLQHKQAKPKLALEAADAEYSAHFALAKEYSEENNRLFIEAYGLQGELSPEVPDAQITLYRPNREEDIKRLVSHTLGCMMGRYSLDKPGLIYAHGGNVGFDPSQYPTFPADPDGIVSVMEAEWFADDAAHRFVEFLGVAWPREGLDENLRFVADALGPTRNEQPRDTIRRYLATGFFKHHLQTYKRRPIYWLFSSGKQRAFQCLVYLHRYHDGTLARMRTEYVIPLQGKLASRIDWLANEGIPKATSTSNRNTLTKERDKLVKQQTELQAYDEKLRHFADMRIALDLDDGVKVNYGKFGDLLAEVKAVTGGRDEE